MKIRNGFVSNSSSSSFIVISNKKDYDVLCPDVDGTLIVDDSFGETMFDWGPDTIKDVGSRIIFSYLQSQYADKPEWLEMLEKVIKDNSGVKRIGWNIHTEYNADCYSWAYIDHQSNAAEDKNIEMFDNEETLKNFIFGKESRIILDNDNN